MTDSFQYDVFLSHSAKDKSIVLSLAERLRGDGLQVWLDDWEICAGDNIPAKIEEGLERSRVLVLCMSANVSESDWVQWEAGTFQFRDPLNKERRLIPLRLDEAHIKASLVQFSYINWPPKPQEQEYAKLLDACRSAANRPTEKRSPLAGKAVEAISRALLLLAEDRFKSDDLEFRRGGWSQTYCTRYVPFAFPARRPETLSLSDSITLTHWIVRGLVSLRLLEKETACLASRDSELLTGLLTDVRVYANNHYRDGRGGLFKILSQQEVRFLADVRHSATLGKALLALSNGDNSRPIRLLKFVMECAIDPKNHDHRVPTHAEILAAVETLTQNPCLRDGMVTENELATVREMHEAGLLALHRTIGGGGRSPNSCQPGLFFDPVAGEHMAPYYTWWALDCCGSQMSRSASQRVRSAHESAVRGLLSFEQPCGSESGFPIGLDGLPDAGATAQIADLLARLDWNRHAEVINRSLRFVIAALTDSRENRVYFPFTIWAFFDLLKTSREHGIIDF